MRGRAMKYLKKFWPTLIISVVGAAVLVVSYGYPLIDVPPLHIDKYDWKRNFPPDVVVEYKKDVLRVELWMSQCDKYEKEPETKHLLIQGYAEPYGEIFAMDCYGNVTWPHGQELGAMFLAKALYFHPEASWLRNEVP